MKAYASSAASSIVPGTTPDEAPTPALSNVITCRVCAIGSTMRGSQLSSVAARCTKKTTGMPPFGPSSRYAYVVPPAVMVFVGAFAYDVMTGSVFSTFIVRSFLLGCR